MSSSNKHGIPNNSETSVSLDVSKCVEELCRADKSAIDLFEESLRSLVLMAAKAKEDRHQIRLLVLGLVSLTENYFRHILSDILSVCPISQGYCSGLEIKYSSASYFSRSMIAQSLTDGSVFSGSKNIIDETKKLTGVDVNCSGSVKAALSEFHKVCVLRHATVHSYGYLGGKNVYDLGLGSRRNLVVALTWEAFQEICDVCQNLVRAYNLFLWRAIMGRLQEKGFIKFNNSDEDIYLFNNLQHKFWENMKINDDSGATYRNLSLGKQSN